MISTIITHLNSILSGMPYFSEVNGISELKTSNGITRPVQYIGGKWSNINTNKRGMTYWRKRSDVSFTEEDSFASCNTDFETTFPMRLFCMTRRELFPSDDSYSADRLAATIVKGITIQGGPLAREIKARRLTIYPTVYSTNSEQLLSDEFNGLNLSDFKYWDLVIALDVDISITKSTHCIEDACDYIPDFCLELETKVALPD